VIFTGEDAASVVFRLGLILYRFCMIFTSLRKFENGDCSKDVTCTDADFQASLMLSDVYLQHSLLMFNNLEQQKEPTIYKMPNNKKTITGPATARVPTQRSSCHWCKIRLIRKVS